MNQLYLYERMKQIYSLLFFHLKHTILVFILILLNLPIYSQQLPYWSTFSDRGFIWNPAMTANWDYFEMAANYRQQWLGFENAPTTLSASAQFPFTEYNMSVGGFFMNDQLGNFNNSTIALTYAYKIRLGIIDGDQLAVGLLGVFNQYRYASKNLIINEVGDDLLTNGTASKMIPNVGLGIYYSSNSGIYYDETHFFVGLSVNDLLEKELIFEDINPIVDLYRERHFTAILGAKFVPDYLYSFEPSIMLNQSFNSNLHLALNLKLELSQKGWLAIVLGSDSTLGLNGGVILPVQGEGFFRLGGLGMYNIGTLGKAQGLGFEFFLSYQFLL